MIVDCTVAVFTGVNNIIDNNFIDQFSSTDLIRFLEVNFNMTNIALTPLIHVLPAGREDTVFAVIIDAVFRPTRLLHSKFGPLNDFNGKRHTILKLRK